MAALVLLVSPVAGAQFGEEVSETMALTDRAPPGVNAEGSGACSSPALHGLVLEDEAPEQQTKAYTSGSSAAFGCPTLFWGPAPGAFNITGDVTVHLFIGCDSQTVMHEPLSNLRVWLVRNGEQLGEDQASIGPVCSPGAPMEAEVSIPAPENPKVNASDTIGVDATPFGSPNYANDNLHVIVGGNESASTATFPGLAEALEPEEPTEDEVANETNDTGTFGNDTELDQQSTSSEGGGIPGPGAALVAGLLGAMAWTSRRDA